METLTDTKPAPATETSSKGVPSGPFWLTRDKKNGELSSKVEVWLVKPDLHRFDDGDVMWLPPLNIIDDMPSNFGEWTVERCMKEVYVYPATERECLKCG
jgi:hypothetical protein